MAFNWNPFRLKPLEFPSSPDKGGEAGGTPASSPATGGRVSSGHSKSGPTAHAFGGAFVPAAFTPPAASRKTQTTAPLPASADEIVIALRDVLPRIPAQFLRPGPHDPKLELRIPSADLSTDFARGRATVRLSILAGLIPQIFSGKISAPDDADVPLPLQKLFAQISALPAKSAPPPPPRNPENGNSAGAGSPTQSPSPTQADSPAQSSPGEDSVSAGIPGIFPRFVPPPLLFSKSPSGAARESAHSATPEPAFNQTRLQTLLITTENLDLEKVARLVVELPGVGGCVLSSSSATHRAGGVPDGFDAVIFQARAAACKAAMEPLKFGAVRALSVHGETHTATFFCEADVCLCVFHGDYGLLPGYTEKLAAITQEVARMIAAQGSRS